VIGVLTNVGINQPIRFSSSDDEISYYGRGSYTAGVSFLRCISSKNIIEIGACYSVHKVAFELSMIPNPGEKKPTGTFETFNIPINIKSLLKNNYFLSYGTIIDIGLPGNSSFTDTQTGFGLNFGAGKEFQILNFLFDITPNMEIHPVLPFSSVAKQQRLLVFGLRLELKNNCP